MTADLRYQEEISKLMRERSMRPKGCAACHHNYLDHGRKNFLCNHPSMQIRFDVTPYVARREFPARCPLVGVTS